MTLSRKTIKIIIVEDDIYYNKLLTKYVQTICSSSFYPDLQFEIKSYTTAHECIEELDEKADILILDYFLFNKEEDDILSGADVFHEFKHYCPDCKVIMISSMKSAGRAADLIKEGLYAYIDKNLNSRDRIGAVLQKAIDENEHIYRRSG